jgi:hypothetical protein
MSEYCKRYLWRAGVLLAFLAGVLPPAVPAAFAADASDPLGGKRSFVTSSNLVVAGVIGDTAGTLFYGQDDNHHTGRGSTFASPSIPIRYPATGVNTEKIFAQAAAVGQMADGSDVFCNFYFTRDTYNDIDDHRSPTYVYVAMNSPGGPSGSPLAIDDLSSDSNRDGAAYSPVYQIDPGDWRYDKDLPPAVVDVRKDVSTTLVAEDWSGDGVSDYILTYRHYTENVDDDDYPIKSIDLVFVYFDGQSLLDALSSRDASKISKSITTKEVWTQATDGGQDRLFERPMSTRTATGDLRGTGTKDFVVFCAIPMLNYGAVYSVTPNASGPVLTRIADIDIAQSSERISTTGNVGLATGDLNGNGKDEFYLIYSGERSDYTYVEPREYDGRAFPTPPGYITETHYYSGPDLSGSLPIEAAVLDFDGDGQQELLVLKSSLFILNNVDYANPDNIYNQWGRAYITNFNLTSTFVIGIDAIHSLSMTAGAFVPQDSSPTQAIPQQLAIGVGADGPSYEPPPLYPYHTRWVVLQMDNTYPDNLEVKQAAGGATDDTVNRSLSTDSTAIKMLASHGGGGIELGEPILFSLESVTPLVIMQAPPRHRDIVSGDFTGGGAGGANPPDASGNSFPDAFSSLGGYSTQYNSTTTDQTINSTTKSSSAKIGVDLKTKTVIPALFFETSISAGTKYANDTAQSESSGTTYKTSASLASAAGKDDMIYANTTSYSLWRYPIISPASAAAAPTDDGSTGQAFLQFVSPSKTSTSLLPTPGRNFSWYEPDHDNFNLFTYPLDVKRMAGYPSGTVTRPWTSAGFEMAYQANMMIGDSDSASAAATITVSTSQSDTSSVTNTLGMSEGIGSKVTGGSDYSLSSSTDEVWKTDSVSTTDASVMQGITVNWPGMSSVSGPYINKSGFKREDQQFYADAAIYTRDDGTLNASYSVSLKKYPTSNPSAMGTYLWGRPSPYNQNPDPGLLLPFRFTSDGDINTSSGSHTLRGLKFTNALFSGALPMGTATTGTFRVYNYSFLNTTGAVTYEVRYQPVTYDAAGYPDDPDPSKATVSIASGTVPAIPGREYEANADNWKDVTFTWSNPPATDGSTGYVHVKLNYAGTQLSVDNDWGYGLYSFLNPAAFSGLPARPTGARPVAFPKAQDASDIDLLLERVGITAGDGETLARSAIPQDKPITLECHIALDGPVPPGAGAPLVFLDLYVNRSESDPGSLIASQHVPYLPHGGKHMFTIDYDPALHRDLVDLKNLTAVVTSSSGIHERDRNPENHIEVMTFAAKESGGSSGCNAGPGLAGFALFALALGAATVKNVKKTK